MAKPILIIKLPYSKMDKERIVKESGIISDKLNNEYHVLFAIGSVPPDQDYIEFECFNDSKGLRDKDIEQLIKEYNESYKES